MGNSSYLDNTLMKEQILIRFKAPNRLSTKRAEFPKARNDRTTCEVVSGAGTS